MLEFRGRSERPIVVGLEGRSTDRQWQEFGPALDRYRVLVDDKLAELLDPVDHALIVGVEQMRPILVYPHPGIIDIVEGIAADMIAAVDHGHPETVIGQCPRIDGSSEAGTDDQYAHPVFLSFHASELDRTAGEQRPGEMSRLRSTVAAAMP